MLVKKEEVSSEEEMTILAFMIMNENVINSAYARYKMGELKTRHFTPFYRPLFRSLISYFGQYNRPPKYTIEQIVRKFNPKDETRELFESYVDRVAEEYERLKDDTSADEEYIIKEIIPDFIREQEGRFLIESINNALDAGKPQRIDEAIEKFAKVSDYDEDESLGTATPYSEDAIRDFYLSDPKDRVLLKLDGAIGQLIPPIRVKTLTAITGVEKSGKTTTVGDIVYQAVKKENLSTLWINCEMDEDDLNEYFWRRLTMTASDREHGGIVTYPVFDCLNNQLDRCEIKKSKNGNCLYEPNQTATFEKNKNWKICTLCRGQKRFTKITKQFVPAIWFDQQKIRVLRRKIIQRAIEQNKFVKLDKIRIKTFPRLSVKFGDVENYIKQYIKKNDFHPKILVIDYPDIIAPEEGKLLDRQNVDFIWKKIAGLTHELNCGTLVPDQAVKTARDKKSISRGDTSESKTKDAHLDTRITLNMTEDEEEIGVVRYGLLYRRKGRTTRNQVMALQRRETGEMMLDSEWWEQKDISFSVKK